MKISDSILEEIRTSVNLVDIISEHIDLKDMGKEHKGLCPFHSEKTPSFHVSPEKGLFHCFGCGASGNLFGFIMRFHNLDFIEAVKYIAERQGISIEEDEKFLFRKDISAINNYILKLANKYYESESGFFVREYMGGRKFDQTICNEFGIGYLPNHLTYKKIFFNFPEDVIKESGLFNFGKTRSYGRFSGRLLIPINNIYGKVIGFSGRILKGEGAKYINSPETPLFKKREVLYNLDKAKDAIKAENHAIVVEGYFDVMRLHQNGIKNSVSPMGTSLTKEQASILKRYADETTLIFDGDTAGKKAAYRALDVFIDINYYPSVVFLPDGEDPDSIVQNRGVGNLHKLINDRKDLLMFIAEKSCASAANYNSRMSKLSKLKEKLVKINDPYRKAHYFSKIAEIFGVDQEVLEKDIIEMSMIENKSENIGIEGAVIQYCEEDFLASLFDLEEDVIDSLLVGIDEKYFRSKETIIIFKKVIEIISNNGNIHTLLNEPEIGDSLTSILVKDFGEEDAYLRAIKSRDKVILNYLDVTKRQKQQELSEFANDKQKYKELVIEISRIVHKEIEIKAHLSEV